MSNLEKAAAMYTENWINALPEEEFIPSPEYIKWRNRLLDKMRNDKYHRLTKRATMVLIAAILTFLLAVGTLAATVGKDFIIRTYYTFANYIVLDSEPKYVKSLELGYIPEGFELTNSEKSKIAIYYSYENENQFFHIDKMTLDFFVGFDSQSVVEEIEINNITYTIHKKSNNKTIGIVWNKNGYIYNLNGNLSKKELIKIATYAN